MSWCGGCWIESEVNSLQRPAGVDLSLEQQNSKVDTYSSNVGEYVHALELVTFSHVQERSFKV